MGTPYARIQRQAAAHHAEVLSEQLDSLIELEAELLCDTESMIHKLRPVVGRRDAEAFGLQVSEALADAFFDERKRLQEALTEAEREAGDEL